MPDYCEFKDCKSGAVSQAQATRTKKQYGKVVCHTHEPDAIKEASLATESLMSLKDQIIALLNRRGLKETEKGKYLLDDGSNVGVEFTDEGIIVGVYINQKLEESGHGVSKVDALKQEIDSIKAKYKAKVLDEQRKGAGKVKREALASSTPLMPLSENKWPASGAKHEEKHSETKEGKDEAVKATETAKPELNLGPQENDICKGEMKEKTDMRNHTETTQKLGPKTPETVKESKGEVKVMSESRKVSAELVPVTEKPQTAIVTNQPTQAEIIERAITTSKLLVDIVEKAKLFSMISGKKYVRVEGWETLGALLLCSSEITKTEEYKNGYKSEAIIRYQDGKVISNGVGICLRSEKNWSNRDDFAICSMSQTRAIGKAYRLGFAWIMSLAGYEVCPVEEMESPEVKT